jgi:hypothetical protein
MSNRIEGSLMPTDQESTFTGFVFLTERSEWKDQ